MDSSAPALELLQRSATANALAVRTLRDDAFDALAGLREAGEKFDVVIVDPPAFIKRRKDIHKGQAAYRKLNQLAMQVLVRDGISDFVFLLAPPGAGGPRPGRSSNRRGT